MMMTLLKFATSTVFIGLLLGIGNIQAQAVYEARENKMVIRGTSTLHDWESDVTKSHYTCFIQIENNKLTAVREVNVTIPVTSIKSTKGRIMDSKTYEAFDSDKNPNIQFKSSQITITPGTTNYMLKASGTLTMAGTTRPINLSANAQLLANGEVRVTGSYPLAMKDFNMTPPTAMMGAIKVGEEVTIVFDVTLKQH